MVYTLLIGAKEADEAAAGGWQVGNLD